MKSTLRVKNFGPIKNVILQLREVNVLIGPQASGKSVLAKLFTIFKAPRKFFFKNGIIKEDEQRFDRDSVLDQFNIENFRNVLEEFNIQSFLRNDTEIEFDSPLHNIYYDGTKLIYKPISYQKIKEIEQLSVDFDKNKADIIDRFIYIHNVLLNPLDFPEHSNAMSGDEKKQRENFVSDITAGNLAGRLERYKDEENKLSSLAASYIQSERVIIHLLKKYSFNLLSNKVPIPMHILQLGAEIEKTNIGSISLDFVAEGLVYKNVDGDDKIFFSDEKHIDLIAASSGIQSVVPILLTTETAKINSSNRTFVFEEPEQNLFPETQYQLIQRLEKLRILNISSMGKPTRVYTTHSPYVLAALNNLLYAFKVKSKIEDKYFNLEKQGIMFERSERDIELNKVHKILDTTINPATFAAYQVSGGTANSIFNEEIGLIDNNYIDDITDKMNDDFDALMNLI
jgi:energy-coupling factor transporter ATP-binding protein EcfA2